MLETNSGVFYPPSHLLPCLGGAVSTVMGIRLHSITYFNFLKLGTAILIICVLQITVMPLIWFLKIKPDLSLILAIIMAMNLRDFFQLLVSVFFCGLFRDVFGSYLFGFYSIVFTLEAVLVYLILRYLYKQTPGLRFIILISATLLNYFGLTIIFNKPFILMGVLEAAVNCLFLPLVSKFYDSIFS